MNQPNTNSGNATRAAFLATGAAGAAFAAAATTAGAASLESLHDLEGVLHRSARHKQVIAATKVDNGSPLRHALNGLNAFEYAYGEGAGSLHVACVFYGPALFMATNDHLWGQYRLFDVLNQANDGLPMMLHTPENPFYHAQPARGRDDFAVESLTRRGVVFMVCNNALTLMTHLIAQEQHVDASRVYDDFKQHLVPGALIVPAGVAAIVLAQEAGYTFLGE